MSRSCGERCTRSRSRDEVASEQAQRALELTELGILGADPGALSQWLEATGSAPARSERGREPRADILSLEPFTRTTENLDYS